MGKGVRLQNHGLVRFGREDQQFTGQGGQVRAVRKNEQ